MSIIVGGRCVKLKIEIGTLTYVVWAIHSIDLFEITDLHHHLSLGY